MAPKKAANRNPVPDMPAHSEAPRAEASSNEASENDLPAVPGGKGKRQAYQEAETAAMVAQVLLDRPFAAAHGDTAAAWDAVAQTLARSVEGLEHLNSIRLQTPDGEGAQAARQGGAGGRGLRHLAATAYGA